MQNLVKESPAAYGPKVGHSLGAVNVGTSVMACKFKGGVIIGADTAISYGGMKKEKNARRIMKLNDEIAFACSGEMADAQNLHKELKKKQEADEIEQDGCTFLKPRDYFNWIACMNYQRRMKMNPLWCSTVVGGVRKDNGEVFLGSTDLYGTKIEHDYILTGLSTHYCQVLMENGWRADLTEDEAKALICECMTVMFYRDKKAADTVQFTVVTKEGGVRMDEPVTVDSNWNLKFYSEQTNEFWRPMRIRV